MRKAACQGMVEAPNRREGCTLTLECDTLWRLRRLVIARDQGDPNKVPFASLELALLRALAEVRKRSRAARAKAGGGAKP